MKNKEVIAGIKEVERKLNQAEEILKASYVSFSKAETQHPLKDKITNWLKEAI